MTWKVQWSENEEKKYRRFEGDKPTEAVSFAKELRGRGLSVDVISGKKAFPPTRPQKDIGTLWCPYCLQWREFITFAIRMDGTIGPERYRCPVCTVGITDYYVRLYNPLMVSRLAFEEEVKKTKVVARGNDLPSLRRSRTQRTRSR